MPCCARARRGSWISHLPPCRLERRMPIVAGGGEGFLCTGRRPFRECRISSSSDSFRYHPGATAPPNRLRQRRETVDDRAELRSRNLSRAPSARDDGAALQYGAARRPGDPSLLLIQRRDRSQPPAARHAGQCRSDPLNGRAASTNPWTYRGSSSPCLPLIDPGGPYSSASII